MNENHAQDTMPINPPPAPATGEAAHTPVFDTKKRHILPAERQFDAAVYGGIGGGLTTALSVLSAYWAKYGQGKEYCENLSKKLAGQIQKHSSLSAESALGKARGWVMTTALMMGGTALLIPMKLAEDKKPEWVRFLHQKFGRKDATPEEVAKTELALVDLDKQPRQTWGSILTGRAVGATAVYVAMGSAGGAINRLAEQEGTALVRILQESSIPAAKKLGHWKYAKEMADVTIQDIIAVMTCTSTLYAYTHLFHPFKAQQTSATPTQSSETSPTPEVSVSDIKKLNIKNNQHDNKPSLHTSGFLNRVHGHHTDLTPAMAV